MLACRASKFFSLISLLARKKQNCFRVNLELEKLEVKDRSLPYPHTNREQKMGMGGPAPTYQIN